MLGQGPVSPLYLVGRDGWLQGQAPDVVWYGGMCMCRTGSLIFAVSLVAEAQRDDPPIGLKSSDGAAQRRVFGR